MLVTMASMVENSSVPLGLNTTNAPESSGTKDPIEAIDFVLFIFVITGVLGNVLVVLAVYKDHNLRNVTNYFVVSLAFADLFVCSLIMPVAIVYQYYGEWRFGVAFCSVFTSIDICTCTASIINLCAISIDRYWAITSPLTYPAKMSSKRCILIIICTWLISIVIAIAQVFWGLVDQIESKNLASISQCSYSNNKWFRIFSSLSSFLIPLSIMVFTYINIFIVARKQARQIKSQEVQVYHISSMGAPRSSIDNSVTLAADSSYNDQDQNGQTNHCNHGSNGRGSSFSKAREWKAAKTLAVVMGVFVLCWLPFFTSYLLESFCTTCVFPEEMTGTFLWLGYVNSSLNPCIYAFFNRTYRKAFRKVLCRKKVLSQSLGTLNASKAAHESRPPSPSTQPVP